MAIDKGKAFAIALALNTHSDLQLALVHATNSNDVATVIQNHFGLTDVEIKDIQTKELFPGATLDTSAGAVMRALSPPFDYSGGACPTKAEANSIAVRLTGHY